MLDLVFIVLGIFVGFNLRHEHQQRRENLVFEQVDAKVRHELEVAKNLNQSLLAENAELKIRLATIARSKPASLAVPQLNTSTSSD
jgi:hypothetical protein